MAQIKPCYGLILAVFVSGLLLEACRPISSLSSPTASTSTPAPLEVSPTVSQEAVRTVVAPVATQTKLTVTAMPEATLDLQNRQAAIVDLLAAPENCRLPCILGLTPGLTKVSTAVAFLSHLGIYTVEYENKQGWLIREGGFDFLADSIYQGISLYQESDTVVGIRVSAESSKNQENLKAIWTRFSPESMVREYGQPSRVFLQAVEGRRGITDQAPYSIWFFYDELQVAIKYQGSAASAATYTICPVFRDAGNLTGDITLYALPASSGLGLKEFIGEELGAAETLKPLEDASEMSIDEFVANVASDHANPCIETRLDMWP